MGEHRIKKRANGRLGSLQKRCVEVGVSNWKLKFRSTLPPRAPGAQPVDMYSVNDPAGAQVITLGMGHKDHVARDFFGELFTGIVPAVAGSVLLLDLYDTLVLLERDWYNGTLRSELSQKIEVIRKAVEPADRPA